MLECDWLARDIGVVPNFLSADECLQYIDFSEGKTYEDAPVTTEHGMVMMKDVRNNDRVMVDDVAMAARLYARIEPFLPPRMNKNWHPCGLNERLRFYRYDEGQKFDWHQDGYYENPGGDRSFLTFMVYLNDGYGGGATLFTKIGGQYLSEDDLRVDPRRGMALIFRHKILHTGSTVKRGRKYVLRTDVMYRRSAGATPA
jgi:predicted 2-oxoglutarate/Fe(II)-dependent dioxygenase YbiX